MIQELVDFGKQVTKGKSKALKEEHFSITLVIDNKGSFQRFIVSERQFVESEAITAKKGKARFLLDKCEEVLGVTIDFDKLESFKKNLEPYKKVKVLEPVFKFYNKLNRNGLKKAIVKYMYLDKDLKCSTFTFMVDSTLLLANEEIKCAINKHIHEKNETKDKDGEYTAILRINKEGEFQNFIFSNSQSVQTESVITNKKESLLLLGKSDEILGITVTMFASANTPPFGDNIQIRRDYTAKHGRIVGCSACGGKVFLADVPF